MPLDKILIGWTTVDSAAAAEKLAAGLVSARLAACVAVDGSVTSHYWWEGKQERAQEWRLAVKFPARRAKEVATWLAANHPYSVPQWIAVEVAEISKAYHLWIVASTRAPRAVASDAPTASRRKRPALRRAKL
jgi:periplasmic divalent cation tolerance protein